MDELVIIIWREGSRRVFMGEDKREEEKRIDKMKVDLEVAFVRIWRGSYREGEGDTIPDARITILFW